MKIKDKMIEYMETCEISFDSLSKQLDIERDKFEKDSRENWSAEELLKICAYLKVDPKEFYER